MELMSVNEFFGTNQKNRGKKVKCARKKSEGSHFAELKKKMVERLGGTDKRQGKGNSPDQKSVAGDKIRSSGDDDIPMISAEEFFKGL